MFTENPTVRDFVFDHVASLDVQGIEGGVTRTRCYLKVLCVRR